MLTGAGAAQLLKGGLNARIVGPLAVVAGVATELAVLSQYPGEADVAGADPDRRRRARRARAGRVRRAAGAPRRRSRAVLAALLVAPGAWAVDTLGHATSGTFPAGGPESAATGGPWRRLRRRPGWRVAVSQAAAAVSPAATRWRRRQQRRRRAAVRLWRHVAIGQHCAAGCRRRCGAARCRRPIIPRAAPVSPAAADRPGGAGFGGGPGGGEASPTEALNYVKRTAAARSRSRASRARPRRSSVKTPTWRGSAASPGARAPSASPGSPTRWRRARSAGCSAARESRRGGAGRLPGDTRKGSSVAIAAAAKVCRKVTLRARRARSAVRAARARSSVRARAPRRATAPSTTARAAPPRCARNNQSR